MSSKSIEILKEHKRIEECLIELEIDHYTINEDFTVDVDGSVYICDFELVEIPIQFGVVTGDFDIGVNELTSLKGCPRKVFGNFDCHANKLLSLDFSPIYVQGDFICNKNFANLTLDDVRAACEVEGDIGDPYNVWNRRIYNR